MTNDLTLDDVTLDDLRDYLKLCMVEAEKIIAFRLATLSKPYTYERRDDVVQVVYTIKYDEAVCGRIILTSTSLAYDIEMERRENFYFAYHPIGDEIRMDVLFEKKYGRLNPTTPAQDATAMRAQGQEELNYGEQKILKVYQDLEKEGLSTSDEEIAARLPLGHKGQPYARETVNRKRQAMRKRGITV